MRPSMAQLRTATLVVLALAAGLVAAMTGGALEDLLDWLFVGVPLVALVALGALRFVGRRS